MTTWYMNAFTALLFFCPIFVVTPILQKTYDVKIEAIVIWWLAGSVVGILLYSLSQGQASTLILSKPTAITLTLGLTVGTIANIAIFQAVAKAPNPGIALAIVNTNCLLVYVIAALLAILLPRHFDRMQMSWQHLIGVLFVIGGMALFLSKK